MAGLQKQSIQNNLDQDRVVEAKIIDPSCLKSF